MPHVSPRFPATREAWASCTLSARLVPGPTPCTAACRAASCRAAVGVLVGEGVDVLVGVLVAEGVAVLVGVLVISTDSEAAAPGPGFGLQFVLGIPLHRSFQAGHRSVGPDDHSPAELRATLTASPDRDLRSMKGTVEVPFSLVVGRHVHAAQGLLRQGCVYLQVVVTLVTVGSPLALTVN